MNKNKRLQFTQKHKHKKEEARKIQTTNNKQQTTKKQEERTGTTKSIRTGRPARRIH
jgi:hypothetical protein